MFLHFVGTNSGESAEAIAPLPVQPTAADLNPFGIFMHTQVGTRQLVVVEVQAGISRACACCAVRCSRSRAHTYEQRQHK
eukprot:101510-Pleurochrysis_carterae.AAC.1